MSKFYILANLKMNKSFDQSVKYLESLSKKVTNYDDEIILFPSNISLEYFSRYNFIIFKKMLPSF